MYKYTRKSLLESPINYSYSSYEGDEFLKEWLIHRLSYCKELSRHNKPHNETITYPKLPEILLNPDFDYSILNDKDSCDFLLQKYESTKKLYSQYYNNKPIENSGFKNIQSYISTALKIENFYTKRKDIRYLNCLLKLCDLFQSDKRFLLYSTYIEKLISKEVDHISNLVSSKSNLKRKEYKNLKRNLKIYNNITVVKGLTLICCNSSRSSIYLQSLINANILPEYIIYMNNSTDKEGLKSYPYQKLNYTPDWLFVPKEYIHPIELAKEYKINLIEIKTKSINSNSIYESLKKFKVKLIIYCGFGGEIVCQKLLKSFSFIHCHAGNLPEFRGSTTFYYEILSERFPSVSCILLNKRIDTGPILATKSFPIPFKTDNIDTLYEPSIRANLLCDVIFDSGSSLKLKYKVQSNKEKNLNYYIIHPVLKHVSFSLLRDPQ